MTEQVHEGRMLAHLQLDPSRRNLTMAAKRVHAAGRLSELGAHMVEGIVRARVVEHGDAELMAHGAMFAEVWLDAGTDREWSERAKSLLLLEDIARGKHEVRLTLAIRRASRLDHARARLSWLLRGIV